MRLKDYLAAERKTPTAFAAEIGVSAQAVHRYVDETRTPRRYVMQRIQEVTAGRVCPNDFFMPADAP